MKNTWSNEEKILLRDIYPDSDWNYILESFPNRTKTSIVKMASKLEIEKSNYFWNENDLIVLKNMYGKCNIKDIVISLNNKFTESSIRAKAFKMNVCNEYWTNEEVKLMNDSYNKLSAVGMIPLLPNRNINSIRLKAIKLNLNSPFLYSDYEVDYVLNNWDKYSDLEIANHINRTWQSVKHKRHNLKLYRIQETSNYISLYEYVRKNNKQWKQKSIENCNYKCVITGDRFNDVHHLHGFNLILDEAINNISLDINRKFNEYKSDDLKALLDEFYRIQDIYPLGVCLSKFIHKDFHDIYGYGNNIQSQFEEFISINNYQ